MSLAAAEAASAEAVLAALEATWPPLRWHEAPGWRVAEGAGGGKRVSSGVALTRGAEPAALVAAQRALGQPALAMIRPGDDALDARLDAEGWRVVDPTVALAAPVARLAEVPPPLAAFEVAWPPLAVQAEIWAGGGVGAARLAVMERAAAPKLALLGRADDSPAATAYAACHGSLAMVHALEVLPAMRRKGIGQHLMRAAALWARRQGAEALAVLVTRANAPALALYRGLGMEQVAGYHYRLREESP
ncbi:GNAT family N-acetyltransferase [Rhodovulum sp. 12E13]|uniref:GNAT family N-acetyltransferase n=1 Tax=Rhodovulum sp. 12E13 TaxID=2203891 RepID=UPI000E12291B|nr:GNAT family N-acetyltransferase [Rhodovulum sp. 12E13]RDC73977.1 GNAT family N-acetyltransferase [Rhodovulum sp. 12E13]